MSLFVLGIVTPTLAAEATLEVSSCARDLAFCMQKNCYELEMVCALAWTLQSEQIDMLEQISGKIDYEHRMPFLLLSSPLESTSDGLFEKTQYYNANGGERELRICIARIAKFLQRTFEFPLEKAELLISYGYAIPEEFSSITCTANSLEESLFSKLIGDDYFSPLRFVISP